jgi:hypothetical protein
MHILFPVALRSVIRGTLSQVITVHESACTIGSPHWPHTSACILLLIALCGLAVLWSQLTGRFKFKPIPNLALYTSG